MTTTRTGAVSADEFFELGIEGRCELVDGEILCMSPSGSEHGSVAMRIGVILSNFVDEKDLGVVFAAETGFKLSGRTVRAADVAVVCKERHHGPLPAGFFEGAPDLVVEVVSPADRASDVAAKVETWLAAGSTSVWVVDPPNRSIQVHRGAGQTLRYQLLDELSDEPVLPGFAVRLSSIFRT